MNEQIKEWHDYFLMTGTAAVTLLGLLFVAVTLNIEVVLHETKTYLLQLARQTFLGFLFVLFISLLFLVPNMGVRIQGTELMLFGAMTAVFSVRALIGVIRHSDPARARRFVILRHAGSLLAGGLLVLAGSRLTKSDPDGLNTLGMTLLLMFGFSSGSAWALLVEVGKMKADLLPREAKRATAPAASEP